MVAEARSIVDIPIEGAGNKCSGDAPPSRETRVAWMILAEKTE